MKVICVYDQEQPFDNYPNVKKGRIYTVYDVFTLKNKTSLHGYEFEAGDYYKLVEMGDTQSYYHDMFIKIEEDQLDETTFERNYKTQTV